MVSPPSAWRSVTLYGVNHSPWVQGIRMALAHHGIPTRLTSLPLSPSWFWRRGLIFPAMQLADGRTYEDSFTMYEELEAAGFPLGIDAVSPEERQAFQAELEGFFTMYALGRGIEGKRWRFIQGWSTMREHPSTPSGIVSRALITNYFLVLIRAGIYLERKRRRPVFDLKILDAQLARWDARLAESQWLSGAAPGYLDFALFGHLQCMTSGLTDELIPLIQAHPALMAWAEAMVARHRDYAPLYVRRLFDPECHVDVATKAEQALFWVAWVAWLMAWPLSAGVVVTSLLRREKNPAHSGAVRRRHRKKETHEGRR